MKITTFNPQIITKDAESIVKLFQEFGFKKHHNPKKIGELKVEGIRMKDEYGFYLDISIPDIELTQDIVAIRVNVDDFDEAYNILENHGFRNFYGNGTVHTKTSESAMMISPSGFAINLIQHIKEDD